ncbi:glucodextranase DOMON-like domain-containing protein [Halanaerobaculum tunisiense]
MNKLQWSLLLCLILILLFTVAVDAQKETIFETADPVGDDFGPGSYTYPTSDQFKPYEGLFDLTNFKVESADGNYNFYFKFKEVTNPWHADYGFSHQMIQVYIDNQDGGSTQVFKPGAHVKFESQHPWNQLIKLTGWSVEMYSPSDDPQQTQRLQQVDVTLEDQVIKLSIPQEKIGSLQEAHYYVLVGSLDGFGYDNYRSVVEEATGWKFGGGTDTDLNPNLLDTLVPEGMSQKEVLGSFDLEEGELATLRAVGPELSLPVKFIIIIAFAIVLLLTVVGAIVKYIMNRFKGV